jgi:hypothetical protein
MKHWRKTNHGYKVNDKTYSSLIGTRAQVWHGTSYKTSGGLTKNDIVKNKSGRIVSKNKHFSAKKNNRLLKHGYGTKKGRFGFVKLNTRKKKGGYRYQGGSHALNPKSYDGEGEGTSGVNLQFVAGNASS